MSSSTRKQAPRLAKPAIRYWKGKAPKGLIEVNSDSDVEEPSNFEEGDIPINDHDEDEGDEGFGTISKLEIVMPRGREEFGQSSEYDGLAEVNSDSDVEEGHSNFKEGDIPINDHDDDEGDEGFGTISKQEIVDPRGRDESSQSSEYESDSDEEPQVEFRPVFIPKFVILILFCKLISLRTKTIL